jgi:ADP-ribose pyrophosphatase YjhB (NUDIX family)
MKYCSNCGEKIDRRIPDGDTKERWVCDACNIVHYQNPKIVVGCVPERDGRILLCKRAIEPRHGYWTVPAGFLELGESIADGAARETLEEACAEVQIGHLFASVDIPEAGQLHLFFTAKLLGDFAAGDETQDARMYAENEIPWDDLAFRSGTFALEKYFADAGKNNGTHIHEITHRHGRN